MSHPPLTYEIKVLDFLIILLSFITKAMNFLSYLQLIYMYLAG